MKQLNVTCPRCNSDGLFYTRYETPLKVLKQRSWLYCKPCGYEVEVEDFKKSLFCP
ncbi:MAG TPA: hypothetical protein VJJ01_02840 [Nitrosopumilaceae archaeon]|nr:hypothetical protein [Nitrosopumilaceae archaeon]